ncbi:MAG: hypothetical protein IJ209_06570 [Bacteroidaceae bacterium]|nr:hypothetical protein [Bacteroidaceae bacterium]
MTVSFDNASLLTLAQTVSFIIGTNIGTYIANRPGFGYYFGELPK